MSKRRKGTRPAVRAEPAQKRSAVMLCNPAGWDDVLCAGYTPLNKNPEIVSAVDTLARLVASMTICLMQNGESGDNRIYNELSRKLDINPNNYMTRYSFIYWIVRTLLLEGNGNTVVYPRTENGYLRELIPIPPDFVSFIPDGMWGYQICAAQLLCAAFPDRRRRERRAVLPVQLHGNPAQHRGRDHQRKQGTQDGHLHGVCCAAAGRQCASQNHRDHDRGCNFRLV